MKKIIIRCITDQNKGFGNLSRCITIADKLKTFQINSHFIIDDNEDARKKLKKKFSFTTIKTQNLNKNKIFIKNLMYKENSNVLLIDMREFGEKLSKLFLNDTVQTILIDDAWGKNAFADLLFNGTVIKKYHNYKKINKESQLFLGSDYWIANENFKKSQKLLSSIKDKKNYKILISMGGSDPDCLTKKIIESIENIKNISVSVVIGPFFSKQSKNLKFVQKNNIKLIHSPVNIWKYFNKSDISIIASGSTLFEMAIQGLPTICVVAFEHQMPYAKFFEKNQACKNLGYWKKSSPKQLNSILQELLSSKEKRKNMHKNSKNLVDGKGTLRVAKIIADFVKKTS